ATTKAIAAESAPTSEAITSVESAAATGAIKAASLETLEPLARKIATRPVLRLAIQITGPPSTGAGSIEAASSRTVAPPGAAGSIFGTRCGRPLLITLPPCTLLAIFCTLPVRLGFVYLIPTSVVVLLPAVTGVLINVTIVSSVHIAAGSFTNGTVSPLRAGG